MSQDPAESSEKAFPASSKIQVLMHEYNSLRTQIIHRTNNAFQLATVGGAMVVWLLSRAAQTMAEGIPIWKDWPFAVCIVLALIGLGMGTRYIKRSIEQARKQLEEIRGRVNALSGESDLLRGPESCD